jgi:hypothetical protein
MNQYYHFANKGNRIRCRQEDDDNYLLYNADTDELHMISSVGKAIFDMCDGRSINDLVVEGAHLLQGAAEESSNLEPYRSEVLDFLCKLRKRKLIELT